MILPLSGETEGAKWISDEISLFLGGDCKEGGHRKETGVLTTWPPESVNCVHSGNSAR